MRARADSVGSSNGRVGWSRRYHGTGDAAASSVVGFGVRSASEEATSSAIGVLVVLVSDDSFTCDSGSVWAAEGELGDSRKSNPGIVSGGGRFSFLSLRMVVVVN
jgi:hypothetical protein